MIRLIFLILFLLPGCEQGWQDERGYHKGPEPQNDNYLPVLLVIAGTGYISWYLSRRKP